MDVVEYYEELDKAQEAYWSSKGKELGYASESCSNCGRYRVIKYENGDGICEKCNWNRRTGEYERTSSGL